MHDLGKGTTPKEMLPRHIGHEARSVSLLKEITKRLRVPTDCKELAQMVAKYHGKLHAVEEMRPSTLLSFLIELDAIRQPERLKLFLQACEADSRGRTGFEERAQPEAIRLLSALDVASSIDAGAVARGIETPEKIKTAVFEARLAAIQSKLKFL